ncbi:MAG: hypothetical protein ITG05_02335 [Pseudomonas stutzeri]|nr:hypothetical protein [Stutzerimonas stutzeri]
MRKLFQIWLSLTIFSLVIYLPFYVFSNNALSAVEEVTPTDLIPFTGIRGQDHERVGLLLERAGVDTSKELEDTLEDNEMVSDMEIRYLKTIEAQRIERSTGLKVVEAVADVGDGLQMKIIFTVEPKRFLRSWAMVNGILALQITDGEHAFNMIETPRDELDLWALFAKSGKDGRESVARLKGRFNVLVAQTQEQSIISSQEQISGEPAQAEQSPQYLSAQAMEQDEELAPSTTEDQSVTRTRAGNLAPDRIVIFKWEGLPAYCADEGDDGINCRGDGASFIGSGTYEDFMDAGSSVCIAGEPGCQLPQYFPDDVRG